MLVGVCEAGIATAAVTLIGDYWTKERDRYIGLGSTVASLGGVVYIGIGGALGLGGWRAPFWVFGVGLVLAALSVWLLRPVAAGERHDALGPLPWRALALPCGVTLVGGVVFYALIVQLSTVLTGIELVSTATNGLLTGVLAIAIATGAALFGRLSRLGRRVLLPVEFAVAGVGMVIVFATSSPVVVMIGAVITGFMSGLLFPTLITWVMDAVESTSGGAASGSGRARRTSGSSSRPWSSSPWPCRQAGCRAASARWA